MIKKIQHFIFISVFVLIITECNATAYPISFSDDQGRQITVNQKPKRVISLVPGITEMIFSMGAGDAVCGVTYFDTYPGEATLKTIVGGFFTPSLKRINELQPDYIFVSELHQSIIDYYASKKCQSIVFAPASIKKSLTHIKILGQIFNCSEKATKSISRIQKQLDFIASKVSDIPRKKRKRVMRLMGRERVMTPGSDSFQNEFIRLAGGIPPNFTKKGHIVSVSLDEWQNFNPQILYGCGFNQELGKTVLQQPGWKDVDAITNYQIHNFPCELTCRVSIHSAYFITWLSATLYPELFQKSKLYPETVFKTKLLTIPLSDIKYSAIAYGHVNDLLCKTLLIDFHQPQFILSTLEGPKDGILTVGNHYFEPAFWMVSEDHNARDLVNKVCTLTNRPQKSTSILITGADMENLVMVSKKYQDLEIHVMATAGVQSNAMRMSKDIGLYYKAGTINLIIMSSRKLSKKAMTRAMITATESKTAALQDMDIRSAYTPLKNSATGTGTDNIIVVQGSSGAMIDQTGGHTKAGELIAKAVYDAVSQAIFKQNGISATRSVFFRLKERKISLHGLLNTCDCNEFKKSDLEITLEQMLLNPVFASFVEMALSLSDAESQGQLAELEPFAILCKSLILKYSKKKIDAIYPFISDSAIPKPLEMTLNTLIQISVNNVHSSFETKK
jgi:ABC-type Fe3+-hydroxamate transport system substrate-binding protein/adenosylcobinamide amidohydrolase